MLSNHRSSTSLTLRKLQLKLREDLKVGAATSVAQFIGTAGWVIGSKANQFYLYKLPPQVRFPLLFIHEGTISAISCAYPNYIVYRCHSFSKEESLSEAKIEFLCNVLFDSLWQPGSDLIGAIITKNYFPNATLAYSWSEMLFALPFYQMYGLAYYGIKRFFKKDIELLDGVRLGLASTTFFIGDYWIKDWYDEESENTFEQFQNGLCSSASVALPFLVADILIAFTKWLYALYILKRHEQKYAHAEAEVEMEVINANDHPPLLENERIVVRSDAAFFSTPRQTNIGSAEYVNRAYPGKQ